MAYAHQYLISAALLAVVSCQTANVPCPDPVTCVADPCLTSSCPNYPNAQCTVDNCAGECRALFLEGRRQIDVSDKCDIPSCETHECPNKRPICVEERVPCPRNKSTCRPSRQVKVSCEEVTVAAPSDCSMVVCGDDQLCSVRETATGPVAQCEDKTPQNCEDLQCASGSVCVERSQSDGSTVVRCVSERLPAEDCTDVVCADGMVCELTNVGRPRCVAKPPPSTCSELECGEGFQCVVRNERRAICQQIATTEENIIQELIEDKLVGISCSDIDCRPGYRCVLHGDKNLYANFFFARCVPNNCPRSRPPLSCQELECSREEYCAMVADEEEGRLYPVCISTLECPNGFEPVERPHDRIGQGRPGQGGPGQNRPLQDYGSGDSSSGSMFECCFEVDYVSCTQWLSS